MIWCVKLGYMFDRRFLRVLVYIGIESYMISVTEQEEEKNSRFLTNMSKGNLTTGIITLSVRPLTQVHGDRREKDHA